MSSRGDILLDFNNMVREGIGANGLARDEIDALKSDAAEIHRGLIDLRRLGQLPFWDLPYHDEVVSKVLSKASEIRDRCETILLLGIGGSALGASFLARALAPPESARLVVVDDLDPREWERISRSIDWRKTYLLAISKSGETLETWAALLFFYEKLKVTIAEDARKRLLIVTDPSSGSLREIAHREKIESLEVPHGVGGRYSVLSVVGILPAACLGVDVPGLMEGARRMDERCKQGDPWFNPALMSAVINFVHAVRHGRSIRVVMPYGTSLAGFAPWYAQLWAESLGKTKPPAHGDGDGARGVGSTPIAALGPRDQHSQLQLYLDGPDDKVVTLVGVEEGSAFGGDLRLAAANSPVWQEIGPKNSAGADEIRSLAGRPVHEILNFERRATEEALTEAGRPNQTVLLRSIDAYALGQLILMSELETVYTGQLLGINPFDQPAVERIKRHTRSYLSGKITPQKNRNYMI